MKALFVLFFTAAALAISMPVLAQGSGAGVTPDSFLYGLDVALDEVRYLLTLDPHGKARVGLEVAEERLAEVREMILQNKLDAVQRAQQEHGKALGRVRNAVNSLPGDEAGEEDADEIEREIRIHEQDITEIRGNLEIQIKSKGQITAEQQSVIDSVLGSLEGETGRVKIKVNEKKNEIKIKIKTGKGKPEILREEIETEIEIEEEETEAEEQEEAGEEDEEETEEIKPDKEAKAGARINAAVDALAQAKAALNSTNATAQQKAVAKKQIEQAEKHLARARDAFEDEKFGEAFGQATAAESQARNALRALGVIQPPAPPAPLNGTISGMKFEDANNNSVKDGNETGLANWIIQLTGQTNATAITDSNGVYSFTNLPAGTYTLSEVLQANWTQTTPANGTYTVEIASGTAATGKDFGNFQG